MKRLENRTAIVTGAASGIGAATARRLAAEGANVVLGDVNLAGAQQVAGEIADAGGTAIAQHMDLNNEGTIKAMIDATMDRFGTLQIVHNNAADMRQVYQDEDMAVDLMEVDLWDAIFHANMRGTMLVTKYALPALVESGNAAIINTSSGAALTGDLYRPAYGASKAAINNFTMYVATQYGKKGVRCNAIAPGIVVTAAAQASNDEERLDIIMRHVLSPEIGRPDDIAGVVAMLASDDGRYINGQVIAVDGGIRAHFAHVADVAETFESAMDTRRAGAQA